MGRILPNNCHDIHVKVSGTTLAPTGQVGAWYQNEEADCYTLSSFGTSPDTSL